MCFKLCRYFCHKLHFVLLSFGCRGCKTSGTMNCVCWSYMKKKKINISIVHKLELLELIFTLFFSKYLKREKKTNCISNQQIQLLGQFINCWNKFCFFYCERINLPVKKKRTCNLKASGKKKMKTKHKSKPHLKQKSAACGWGGAGRTQMVDFVWLLIPAKTKNIQILN